MTREKRCAEIEAEGSGNRKEDGELRHTELPSTASPYPTS